MDELLFLAHRIPYPPNKGDKLRSHHLLRALAGRYRVHVGTFADDPADLAHAEALAELAGGETLVLPLDRRRAQARALAALPSGLPLGVAWYRDRRLQRWVEGLAARRRLGAAVAFSGVMAQYLLRGPARALRRVVDFVDVDSEKWRQYARAQLPPMSWVYALEARRLRAFEAAAARQVEASVLVSEPEAALFRRRAPGARQVAVVPNGVDAAYFDPAPERPNPYPLGVLPVVFTGAMDYWANADAVEWFARKVWPLVRERRPEARFFIVGARPAPEVQELARVPGVFVVGAVPDVRPYLAHAEVAVAPLRIARGIQNKVLEAMAMGLPTVATPQAAKGLSALPGEELVVARGAEAFAAAVAGLLGQPNEALRQAARRRVLRDYRWDRNLEGFLRLLDPEPGGQARSRRPAVTAGPGEAAEGGQAGASGWTTRPRSSGASSRGAS